MFRWYQKAAKCYVYLTDVSAPSAKHNREQDQSFWEQSFRDSRWFMRGWTLQELLAPTSVEFFSKEKQKIGDRLSLVQELYEVTGVPYSALQGTSLYLFSVNERLSWRKDRKTKLGEDGAYSMLGLFGIYIEPLYGEGSEVAFRRLQDEIRRTQKCIQDVRLTDPRDDKTRIEETKRGLLRESYRWILDNASFTQWHRDPSSQLLWIKGDHGKEKTMLLCGVINELKNLTNGALVSYFFCQASDSRINSATSVLRGLLYLLVSQQPWLAYHVRKRYDEVENKTLFEDSNAWTILTEVLTHMLQDVNLPVTYLVIDALDEYD